MHNKIFYATIMFGHDVWWPANYFNNEELEVIERFLKELNEHISGEEVDEICVFDNDEEE